MSRLRSRVTRSVAVVVVGLVAAVAGGASYSRTLQAPAVSVARCVLPPPTRKTTEGAPSSALLSILGVLRRPRTAADSLEQHWSYSQQVFVRYVRRARDVAGTAYYVVPALFTSCEPGAAYQAVIFEPVPASGSAGSITGILATPATIRQRGVFLTPGDVGMGSTVAGLVPDGVRAVLLLSADQASRRNRRSIEDYASSNVVLFRNAPPTWSKTIWYGARGTILRTLNGPRPAIAIKRGAAPKPR